MENKIYDVTIIGGGPAGLTAAIYAGRANKTVALVEKESFGGNIARSPRVENIPGFVSISGADFAMNMYDQVAALPTVETVIDEVKMIAYKPGLFIVVLDSGEQILSKTVIVATGTKHKELKLQTKDVYYCATCDGPFFKGKNVCVVGSGNSGAAYALELATYCKTVYLCDTTAEMCCEKATAQKINENNKIHWLPRTTIKSVKNDVRGDLSSVIFSNNEVVKLNAIFAAIGQETCSEAFSQYFDTTENGYLVVDAFNKSTKVPGIFAAGDCISKQIRQVTTAVNDGTVAAINAIKYIEDLK